jgi:hypothetical protein
MTAIKFTHSPYHDLPCPKCGAPVGAPCSAGSDMIYTSGWVHKDRRGSLRTRKPPGAVPRAAALRCTMVHCPTCRSSPGEPCKTRTLPLHEVRPHKARLARYAVALRAVVPASECTAARMAGGNERKFGRVIMQGKVHQWVGIGWVDEGPPKFDDDLLPRVIDSVYFLPTKVKP